MRDHALRIGTLPKRRLDALTSLRFIAAAMIVFHHFKGNSGVPAVLPFNFNFNFGVGVSFFFVLSGFILFYNYPTLPTWDAKRRFVVARFARLWPAHVTAIALTFLIAPGYVAYLIPWSAAMLGHVILTVAMVQTWAPLGWMATSFNDPIFVMACEIGWISRALSVRPLVLGGDISYSIYLLHWPLLYSDIKNLPTVAALPKLAVLSITLGLLLALSYLMWAYIERPGRKYIVELAAPRAPQPAIL